MQQASYILTQRFYFPLCSPFLQLRLSDELKLSFYSGAKLNSRSSLVISPQIKIGEKNMQRFENK